MRKIIKYGRHIICFILVALIVLIYGINAYAADTSNGFKQYYGLTETDTSNFTYLSINSMRDRYSALGYNVDTVTWTWYWNCQAVYGNWFVNNIVNGTILLPTSDTVNNVSYNYNNRIIFNNDSGTIYVYNIASTTHEIAIINGYVVSSEPFHLMSYRYESGVFNLKSNYGAQVHVTSQSANGLYCANISTDLMSALGNLVSFTDLPIYFPSSDEQTGFTNFSVSETDFSFEEENYNFNYFLSDNMIVNPNPAPVPEPEPEDNLTQYNMKFGITSFYAANSLNIVYHNMRIQWNQYTLDHPEHYWLCADYYIQYQDRTMGTPTTFYFNGTDLESSETLVRNVAGMAYSGNNNGQIPTTWFYGLPINNFQDSSGKRLTEYLEELVEDVTGTTIDYIDATDYFDLGVTDSIQGLTDWVTSHPAMKVKSTFTDKISQFTLYGEVYLSNVDPEYSTDGIEYTSYTNITKYNFLDGETSVISTDNKEEPYLPVVDGVVDDSATTPLVVGTGTVGQTTNTYGGPVAYGGNATIQPGAIVINQNGQDIVVDLPTLQGFADVIAQIKNDIVNIGDNNSFLPVVAHTFSFIPTAIWAIMLTAFGFMFVIGVIKMVTRR